MPKKNEVKVYGTVEAVKVANGVSWVKVIGIENDAGKELVCYSDSMDDKFKGTILKAGDRLLIKAEKDKGKVSYVKLYVDKPKNGKKPNTGMMVGFSLKCAVVLHSRFGTGLIEAGKLAYDVNEKVKNFFLEKYPNLNENELGQSIGNCTNNACYLIEDLDMLEDKVKELQEVFVKELTDYIESGE